MKLIIQIPCYNEAESLAATIGDLPKTLEGIECIETLVIDDGSTDGTEAIATNLGVNYVIRSARNKGLARTFSVGIRECLSRGADIIVNTDADNQYRGCDIERLIQPILCGNADLVIGSRPIERIDDFSWMKKKLQRIGTGIIRLLTGLDIEDATSGFRAYSKNMAEQMTVITHYSYIQDNLFQASAQGFRVLDIPIETNAVLRRSRLYSSIPSYLMHNMRSTTVLMWYYYRVRLLGCVLIVIAFFLCFGFLIYNLE